jgi:ribosome-associated toxin RatA of RatAB toxin-antitoxin module
MKDLQGTATTLVAAPLQKCLDFLAAVDRYPDWYPEVVQSVEVLERGPDGAPTRVRTKLHVAYSGIVKDFDLVMAVVVQPPGSVDLTRVADHGSEQRFDVSWRLHDEQRTRLNLDLRAALNVPRFLPLGGIGKAIAEGFVTAASRRIESGDGR